MTNNPSPQEAIRSVQIVLCRATDCQHNKDGNCVIRGGKIGITSTGQCGGYRYTPSKRSTVHDDQKEAP